MNKRELANKLESSEVIGKGEVTFSLLVEHSAIVRYKYTFLSSSKKQVLKDIEEFLGIKFLFYGLGDSTWLLKPSGDSIATYTLIREV